MNIGEQIRDARTHKHLSQDELAALIHVLRGKVTHWETGLREPESADIKELEKVFQTLDKPNRRYKTTRLTGGLL